VPVISILLSQDPSGIWLFLTYGQSTPTQTYSTTLSWLEARQAPLNLFHVPAPHCEPPPPPSAVSGVSVRFSPLPCLPAQPPSFLAHFPENTFPVEHPTFRGQPSPIKSFHRPSYFSFFFFSRVFQRFQVLDPLPLFSKALHLTLAKPSLRFAAS